MAECLPHQRINNLLRFKFTNHGAEIEYGTVKYQAEFNVIFAHIDSYTIFSE